MTVSATVCALAPGYVALTMICGGAIAGNCEIGRTLSAIAPASTMMMATAEAKTGRSMKNSTMAGYSRPSLARSKVKTPSAPIGRSSTSGCRSVRIVS